MFLDASRLILLAASCAVERVLRAVTTWYIPTAKQVARYKLLDDNYNKTNLEGFDIGGINLLLVYSDVDGKNLVAIGFVELVAVQMESVSDTKGSMTLNFYFQKD